MPKITRPTITSNTILKNDMPFIDMVLRNVEPFVDEMIITISNKSNDGTMDKVEKFAKDFPMKVQLRFESVSEPKFLTQVRQDQLNISHSDWIFFVDSDDYWPENRLKYIISFLDNDIDALAVSPYQVIDFEHYERQWTHMGFTKFFRNQKGVHYEGDWPRDLIYKDKELLYWKTNNRVPMIPCMFYHLSRLKYYSFRSESWAKGFEQKVGQVINFNKLNEKDLERIYKCLEK